MKRVIILPVFLTAALLALISVPSSAQSYVGDGSADANDTLRAYLTRTLREDVTRLAVTFWEERLNAYKVRIDDILSSRDLGDLNELRVQFALSLERMQKSREETRKRYEAREQAYSATARISDTAYAVAPPVAAPTPDVDAASEPTMADTSALPSDANVAVASLEEVENPEAITPAEPVDSATQARQYAEMERMQREQREQYRIESNHRLDSIDAAIASGTDIMSTIDPTLDGIVGMVQPAAVAKWLGRNYRSQLNDLADVALADIHRFIDTLDVFRKHFISAHAGEIARVPEIERELGSTSFMDEFQTYLAHPHYMKAMYTAIVEPFVMLYNGEGFGKLIGVIPGAHEAAADTQDHSMLSQNAPNPVSASTTVSYTLPAASSETTLRVLDARGEVIMEVNEGAKEAGPHSAQMDASKLPTGWYLYQLSAHLPQGTQVSARVMQVTH